MDDEVLAALGAYEARTGGRLAPSFVIFMLDQLAGRAGEWCGWCGMSLRRHAITFLKGLGDDHRFREASLN